MSQELDESNRNVSVCCNMLRLWSHTSNSRCTVTMLDLPRPPRRTQYQKHTYSHYVTEQDSNYFKLHWLCLFNGQIYILLLLHCLSRPTSLSLSSCEQSNSYSYRHNLHQQKNMGPRKKLYKTKIELKPKFVNL